MVGQEDERARDRGDELVRWPTLPRRREPLCHRAAARTPEHGRDEGEESTCRLGRSLGSRAAGKCRRAQRKRHDRVAGISGVHDREAHREIVPIDRPGHRPGRELSGPQQFGHLFECRSPRQFVDRMASVDEPVVGELGDRRADAHVDGGSLDGGPAATPGRESLQFAPVVQRGPTVDCRLARDEASTHIGIEGRLGHAEHPSCFRRAHVRRHGPSIVWPSGFVNVDRINVDQHTSKGDTR